MVIVDHHDQQVSCLMVMEYDAWNLLEYWWGSQCSLHCQPQVLDLELEYY
jgi:hypothetical protein